MTSPGSGQSVLATISSLSLPCTVRLPSSPIAPYSVSRFPRNEGAQCFLSLSQSAADIRRLSSGIGCAPLKEESPAMNNVAFDSVRCWVERLAVRIVPGDQLPLAIPDRDDLTAYTV